MSKIKKLIKRMGQNPRDWRMEDLEVIARHHEVSIRKSGGSHVVFGHPEWIEHLTVPARRPIKPIYIEKFISLINKLENYGESS